MSDYAEYYEYYKRTWEKALAEQTSELQAEIARLKEENARYREAIAAVLISHIATETLKGVE